MGNNRSNIVFRTELHRNPRHFLPGGKYGAFLPVFEAPVHQSACFLNPGLHRRQTGYHHDQAPLAALGRAYKAISRRAAVSGLHSIRTFDSAQQRIAVDLGDTIPAERTSIEVAREHIRMIVQYVPCHIDRSSAVE